jgi:nitroreductase
VKNLLRFVLPLRVRRLLKRMLEWLEPRFLQVFAWSGPMASLYYGLFNRQFDREHRAVLSGRLAHHRSLRRIGTSSPQLRRNIHRLEKGLIMRPRRPTFAEGFILETVRAYASATARPDFEEGESKWARDVLDEYFSVVRDSPIVAAAHAEYETVRQADTGANEGGATKFKPYLASSRPSCNITPDDLITLFARRRSVRWFQDRPVPPELIGRAVSAASMAPSACNRQPFRFVAATGFPTSSAIANCAGGTAGFSQQVPAIVVVVGDLSAYPLERDRHLIYIDASLASMQFMLAAETLGLATCPINWPDVVAADRCLLKLLRLRTHERVIMLIAVGYAREDGEVPYSNKKGLGLMLQWFGEE